jgi:NADH-quinone oxidoreductase subunit N
MDNTTTAALFAPEAVWGFMINFLPDLVLLVVACVLLLEEMIAPRRTTLIGQTAVIGLLLALGAMVGPATAQISFDPRAVTAEQRAFGGTLAADGFSLLFKVVAILSTVLVVLMSLQYSERFRNPGEFYSLLVFATLAATLVASASDLVMIYLAIEFLSIASYALVGYLKFQPRSTEAAIKYFLYGAIAAAVMLYGISLLYGLTGTTSLYGGTPDGRSLMTMLGSGQFAESPNQSAIFLALTLVVVGFGFKTALIPFHQWVPDVYDGAPLPVTAWLSVASKAAGFAVFIRFFATTLPPEAWTNALALLAALTMTLGNLAAIPQTNIKRMLAYSSIAHAGYVFIGLASYRGAGFDQDWSLLATLVYVATYLFMNLGAFAVVMAVYSVTRSHRIEDYAGVAQRAPALAMMMAFFMLSLAGIPPTAGFLGKLFIFGAAIRADLAWLAIVGIINAVISLYYYFNVVRAMYLLPAKETTPFDTAPGLRAALAVAILGTIGLLIFAQGFLQLFGAPAGA